MAKPGYALEHALPFLFHCNKRALKTPNLPKLECGKKIPSFQISGHQPFHILYKLSHPQAIQINYSAAFTFAYTCCNLLANLVFPNGLKVLPHFNLSVVLSAYTIIVHLKCLTYFPYQHCNHFHPYLCTYDTYPTYQPKYLFSYPSVLKKFKKLILIYNHSFFLKRKKNQITSQ